MLSDAERRELLTIARAAITARVTAQAYGAPRVEGALARCAGAFVTLRQGALLRGCIGYTERDRPLGDVVARCATAAATEDPRFPPVTAAELAGLALEVSVLGPIEPVADLEEIEVGHHGLVVEEGARRGLLLPQVATEWGWDRETFLAQACVKAGLRPDAWNTGACVYRFQAEVFGEEDVPPTTD